MLLKHILHNFGLFYGWITLWSIDPCLILGLKHILLIPVVSDIELFNKLQYTETRIHALLLFLLLRVKSWCSSVIFPAKHWNVPDFLLRYLANCALEQVSRVLRVQMKSGINFTEPGCLRSEPVRMEPQTAASNAAFASATASPRVCTCHTTWRGAAWRCFVCTCAGTCARCAVPPGDALTPCASAHSSIQLSVRPVPPVITERNATGTLLTRRLGLRYVCSLIQTNKQKPSD